MEISPEIARAIKELLEVRFEYIFEKDGAVFVGRWK